MRNAWTKYLHCVNEFYTEVKEKREKKFGRIIKCGPLHLTRKIIAIYTAVCLRVCVCLYAVKNAYAWSVYSWKTFSFHFSTFVCVSAWTTFQNPMGFGSYFSTNWDEMFWLLHHCIQHHCPQHWNEFMYILLSNFVFVWRVHDEQFSIENFTCIFLVVAWNSITDENLIRKGISLTET